MSDVVVTAVQIAPIFPEKAVIFPAVAAAAITKGQLVYFTAAGKVDVADGNGSGTTAPCGVALEAAGAGQATSVLKEGHVFGFTVSALANWDPLYMSDTAGALGTTAGSASVIVGRVVPMSDAGTYTKVFYVDLKWS